MKKITINSKKLNILPAILLIAWICIIWGHSMMPAAVSQNESNAVLDFINKLISFTGISLTSFMVRKAGHFTEYAILGVLLFSNFKVWSLSSLNNRIKNVIALFAGTMVALIDESIQAFTPGRSCEVRDVWIDFAGVLTGIIIIRIILYFAQKKRT